MTTLSLPRTRGLSAGSRRAGLSTEAARLWRRIRPGLIVALPLLLLAIALGLAVTAWRVGAAASTVTALQSGRDVAVGTDASDPVLLARAQFLAKRGRTEEAEAMVEALARPGGPADLAGRGRYALANARLRQAMDHLERGDLDPAGPLINLARQDYRRALLARPDYWDAKFNLDVASRLLRDFPEYERKGGDDLKAEPKKIWTDIPGQPRGAP